VVAENGKQRRHGETEGQWRLSLFQRHVAEQPAAAPQGPRETQSDRHVRM